MGTYPVGIGEGACTLDVSSCALGTIDVKPFELVTGGVLSSAFPVGPVMKE